MFKYLEGAVSALKLLQLKFTVAWVTALLALFAARQGEPPILGDITAMLVLAQPAGRLYAAISFGLPQGFVLFMCAMELTAGLALLLLRPAR